MAITNVRVKKDGRAVWVTIKEFTDSLIVEPTPTPVPTPIPTPTTGNTYYVATTGNDANSGTLTSPWKTISRGWQSVKADDVLLVADGTYQESLYLTRSGTLRARNKGKALIRGSDWNGISVQANYVTIDGFDISDHRGDGIEANDVHHVSFLNNICRNNGESGIQTNRCDFVSAIGNTCYYNASSGWFSGISLYQNKDLTGTSEVGEARNVVKDNTCFSNLTNTGMHTDGNGIIIDDWQWTQTSGNPNYTKGALVQNNICYNNGGKGIQVTWSDNITVKNNTCWHNNKDDYNTGTWRGEISSSMSSGTQLISNIAVVDPSGNLNNTAIDFTSYGGYINKNVVWKDNVIVGEVRLDGGNAAPTKADGNLFNVDPQFINAPSNFNLLVGSVAKGRGATR